MKDLIKKQEEELREEFCQEFFGEFSDRKGRICNWWFKKIAEVRKKIIEFENDKIKKIIKDMPDTFPELERDDYDQAYQDAKQYILDKLK